MVSKSLTGREALGHLNETFSTLRQQLDRLDRDIQDVSSRVTRARLEQSDVMRGLARVRLDAIEGDSVTTTLTSAERQAGEILEQRERALEQTQAEAASADAELDRLEARRAAQHEEVDAAAGLLAEREAAAQAALEADAAFQEQLARSQEADAVAVSAADKAVVAAKDRAEKRKPYDADPLFRYLWERHYGTEAYRANPLARLLDGWVARVCRYEPARRDYWMLKEIPKRLEQHAEACRDRADEELEKLTAIEERVAAEHGAPDAQRALDKTEQEQDRVDEAIEQSEQRLLALRNDIDRYALREDEYTQRCIGILSEAMTHRSIGDLTSAALATMTSEDDDLIERLRDARRQEQDLAEELAERREMHKNTMSRLQELADVRKRFKRRRYDDIRSGFENGDALLMLLQGLLRGTTRGGSLWDALRRQQRYRDVAGAWPDFGSGGIAGRSKSRSRKRRRRTKPTWHWPGRRGGKGGFRLPKMPGGFSGSRRGRGGFRTGGGF